MGIRQKVVAYFIAGSYFLVICHKDWEPQDGDNGVNDEGEKQVLVKGDSLAAETSGRDRKQTKKKVYFFCSLQGSNTLVGNFFGKGLKTLRNLQITLMWLDEFTIINKTISLKVIW